MYTDTIFEETVYVYLLMLFMHWVLLVNKLINVCPNSVIFENNVGYLVIIGLNGSQSARLSVSGVLFCLVTLNIKHAIMLREVKFHRHSQCNCDAFLCDVF